MNTISQSCVIATSLGKMEICVVEGLLVRLSFVSDELELRQVDSPVMREVIRQVQDYCAGKRREFDLPLKLTGSALQHEIWQRLRAIPFGASKTYGEIAEEVGTSPRVVGNACRRNPVALVVPCHRVVAKHKLGGFFGETSGPWLDLKERLLTHEGGFY